MRPSPNLSLLIAPVLALSSACATLSPPRQRTDRALLASEPISQTRPGPVRIEALAWEGEVLHAKLREERSCQPALRRSVRLQRVEERESHLVALDITLGAVLTLGGGALLASTLALPNQVLLGTEEHPSLTLRGLSVYGGLGLLAAGTPFLIHGIVQGSRSRDRPVGEPWTERTVEPTGPWRACTTDAAGAPLSGWLRLWFADSQVHEAPQRGGDIQVDLLALRSALCRDERYLGIPLRLRFERPGAAPLTLAERSLDDCIRRERAALLIEQAHALLESGGEADTVAATEPLVQRAADLLAALPQQDPGAARLGQRLAALRAQIGEVAQALLKKSVAQVLERIQGPHPRAAVDAAAQVLALSRGAPGEGAAVARQIYGGLAQAALAGEAERGGLVLALLNRDLPSRGCLSGATCPEGVSREELDALIRPVGARLAAALQGQRGRLLAALAALERRVGEAQ